MPQSVTLPRALAAIGISLVALMLFMVPANTALYNLVLFPWPDPRTPDVAPELQKIRAQNISVREVTFPSKNGNRLHGILFEKPGEPHRKIFLLNHGKGNNIYSLIGYARVLLACGASVFLYDYQGFGRSQGRTTIEGTCEDAFAAYDFLHDKQHWKPSEIIAVGQSWGAGPTGQLAERKSLVVSSCTRDSRRYATPLAIVCSGFGSIRIGRSRKR